MVKSKSKQRRTTKKIVKRSVSARNIQDLRMLSEQIGNIIPATSPKKGGFCFQTIAKNYGLKKYWPRIGTKKELIFGFLKEVYKKHPRLIYKIFRENLARGIERRIRAGDPVLVPEIQSMNSTLTALEIKLTKEIRELNLPAERPSIVPPPIAFQNMIKEIGLHPYLQPDCQSLFKDGYLNEAVRKALEKYESYIQKKSGLHDQGKDLMAKAFDPDGPKITVAEVSTPRGKGIQDGFKFISMGSMAFWRNFTSHGDERQIPHQDAFAVLATVSHMLHYIDKENK